MTSLPSPKTEVAYWATAQPINVSETAPNPRDRDFGVLLRISAIAASAQATSN